MTVFFVVSYECSKAEGVSLVDTRLYHAMIVSWLNAYKIVPGLANVYGTLGSNSLYLQLAAGLDVGPWDKQMSNVLFSLFYTVFILYTATDIVHAVTAGAVPEQRVAKTYSDIFWGKRWNGEGSSLWVPAESFMAWFVPWCKRLLCPGKLLHPQAPPLRQGRHGQGLLHCRLGRSGRATFQPPAPPGRTAQRCGRPSSRPCRARFCSYIFRSAAASRFRSVRYSFR